MSSYEIPATTARSASPSTLIPLRRRLGTRWISVLTLIALLTVWWAVTANGLIEPLFLPPPSAVLQKGWLLATTGYMDSTLWQHLGASLSRIGLGLGFAVLTAVPVGIAIGHNRIARGILDPLIEFYRPIPPLAYLPLIVIWCGIGELSKVLLIYLAIFAPIAIATATGVRTVDPAAQSLGATRAQLIRHVILPSALPDILTGVRIGLGVGWSTLVAAELIAATSGLGFMVQSAAQFLVTDVVVLGILVIALIAFAMEMGLRALQRKLVPWHGQAH
ncbi:taurine ABC transporter permease [Pseudomonas fluorescens HK44]|uniref:Taurine ABC transporter permease n=1 Tax=Pseudomonas fluorescens HK44 TaxID=1042209 RepID=A0A010SD97_PSEFL|nr:taurine ABC transporter permease TauC [Pseudomonas fluorescens]EXF91225.1 taurine ABC transporter permease [Pseudomonas fluorescens HK44]